jgi:hypothetical protein
MVAKRVAELEQIEGSRGLTGAEEDEWRRIDWPHHHADPEAPPPFLERETCPAAAREGMADTRRLLAAGFFLPLRSSSIPPLVISGETGPFPAWVFEETADLIPGTRSTSSSPD